MSYNYETERPWLFTEDGQRDLLMARDHIQRVLKTSGAIMMVNCHKGLVGSS